MQTGRFTDDLDVEDRDAAPVAEKLGQRVRRATIWMFLDEAYGWGAGFASRIVLARLLFPRDFGLIALVTLVQQFVQLLGARGVAAALIHRDEKIDEYANACFWLNPLVGAVIGAIQIAVAPLAAAFYREPMMTPLLRVAAIQFFTTPWGATHATLLDKRLQVKPRTLRRMVLTTLIVAGTVIMALRGYGVWSFVVPPLLVDPLEVLVNWRLIRWRPRLTLGRQYWRDIIAYGKHILGGDALRYLVDNTDYLLMGRFLGAVPLGFYSFAFRQSKVIMRHVTIAAGRVTFPTFALLQNERDELHRAFTKSLFLIASLTFPLQFSQLVLAPEYFAVLFGHRWLPAVPAFRVLLLYGVAVGITPVPRQLLSATGRPDLVWKSQALLWPLLAIGVIFGLRGGIVGVATAVGVIVGGGYWAFTFYASWFQGWGARGIISPLTPPLVASALMSGGVFLLARVLHALGVHAALVLLIGLPAAGCIYALALAVFFPQAWRELRTFILRSLGRTGGRPGPRAAMRPRPRAPGAAGLESEG